MSRIVFYRVAPGWLDRPVMEWHTMRQLHISRECASKHVRLTTQIVRQVFDTQEVPHFMLCSMCTLKGSTRNLIAKKKMAETAGLAQKWRNQVNTPWEVIQKPVKEVPTRAKPRAARPVRGSWPEGHLALSF